MEVTQDFAADDRALYATLLDTAKTHWTPCGTGRMCWREWGAGAPVVLLHGGSGSWRHWLRNIPALSEHYRVLVADLPGLGDSDMPPHKFDHADLVTSTQQLADVVMDGIKALTREPVHVVGFSAGSITGAQMASMHPEVVVSMNIAGGSGLGLNWGGLTGKLQQMQSSMTRAEQIAVQAHNASLIMLHGVVAPDAFEAELQLENAERARLRTHPLADSSVLLDALPSIKAPLHITWGKNDPYALPNLDERAALIHQHFPNAEVNFLDNAGHWVMYQRSDAYNPILMRQLADPGPR
jgi:2-hydroxy-6-oxonona-2,4-dienedioate hydrolase